MSDVSDQFIIDNMIRSFSIRDMIYQYTNPKDNLERDSIAVQPFVTKELFQDIREYLMQNVILKEYSGLSQPKKVEYHPRFGWTIIGEHTKAYLGKCSINGSVSIQIGSSSYFSGGWNVNGEESIQIGSYSSIAAGVQFFTSNINHPTEFLTTYNFHSNARMIDEGVNLNLPEYYLEMERLKTQRKSILIGSDVWIGRDAIVMPGVTIPNGCVVGARTLVTTDLRPYGIYNGSPAKLIKLRFSKEIISKIENLKWWNWSPAKIQKNISLFDTRFNSNSKSAFVTIEKAQADESI
jgi:virginiamycin A acetyltransferase